MSDDDRDIDIESDDDNDSDNGINSQRQASSSNTTQADKRAHHNALERKRRDQIKESFTNLREAVPTLKGEKASRAQILKKTTECIQVLRRKISESQKNIDDLKKQNSMLEGQIRRMETTTNGYDIDDTEYVNLNGQELLMDDDDSDMDDHDFTRRNKKMKTFHA